jgi:hypothetical protein
MIIYCDTSWLLSYLNEDDENHALARTAAGKLTGPSKSLINVKARLPD